MAKKVAGKTDERRPLLELISSMAAERSETMRRLQAMLALPRPKEEWRGIMAVPPGSLLEKILGDFRRNTDIPLELPFFVVFALLAGFLLHAGVHVVVRGGDMDTADDDHVDPDIWLLLLASSGSSKSLTFKKILKAADPRVRDSTFGLDGIQSAAAFYEILKEHNKKLAVRDEFGEMYKQLGPDGKLNGVRDMLLRIYNRQGIEWTTKKDGTSTIDDAALCIIGMTVGESFCSSLTVDDLINGTAQRFYPVIARDDPTRPMINFPFYRFHSDAWKPAWTALVDSIKHKAYVSTPEAMEGYSTAFRLLFSKQIDKSFYRRVLWGAHKYALLYHVICGHGEEQTLSAEDYGWAARALSLHLNDLRELMFSSGLSPLQRTLQKTEQYIKRRREKGDPVNARALVTGIRDIRTVAEARALLQLLSEPEDPTPKKTQE